ncbi:MAG: hypothetical protein ACI8ZN_000612 [Bacteroidia bacterium]|jgi:hypothetical protein
MQFPFKTEEGKNEILALYDEKLHALNIDIDMRWLIAVSEKPTSLLLEESKHVQNKEDNTKIEVLIMND